MGFDMKIPAQFRCMNMCGQDKKMGQLMPDMRPCLALEAGQILLKIAYAGVNRPDILQRKGLYAPPKGASDMLGLEASGVIVARGANSGEFEIGQKVCALLHGGGYADYAVAEIGQVLPVPQGLSLLEAAALPETFFTVWSNVFEHGNLKAGERFLVHGGSSGIGTVAIQLAHHFGARVFTTAGSADKCQACEKLGAVRAIDYTREDFVEIMRQNGGADFILDMVGGSYIQRNVKALADDGRICLIAFLQGARAEVNFAEIMIRRLNITGSTLRPRSVREKMRIAQGLRKHVWPLLQAKRIKPVIDTIFDLEDAEEAHSYMIESKHIGKIMLRVDSNLE